MFGPLIGRAEKSNALSHSLFRFLAGSRLTLRRLRLDRKRLSWRILQSYKVDDDTDNDNDNDVS